MKTQVLIISILLVFVASCIKDKSSNPCGAQTYSYQTLDSTSKSKVPYLNTQFDTISYASNKGDTLVFVRQAKDSVWYCKDYYSNKDCSPNYNCYETYGAKYSCIKGNGSFEFKHWYRSGASELGLPAKYNSYEFGNILQLKFNNENLIINDYLIEEKKYSHFVNSISIGNREYKDVIYDFHNGTDSLVATGYYSKSLGLFYLQETSDNINWTLIKP